MTRTLNVDLFSVSTVRLTMCRDEIELATGSGFLWRHADGIAVVTAWHCLTGTNPVTLQSLSRTGARPNKLTLNFISSQGNEVHTLTMPLYNEDGRACWVIHPLGSRDIDIAAIPIPKELPCRVINEPINSFPQADMRITVGSDLFILGYPRNLHRLGLPIWKRASLAIDPEALLDQADCRHLLVDTASREGLSGGAVVARREGSFHNREGRLQIGAGLHTKIIGIYTGRVASEDQMAAQIGIVWPIRYVEALFTIGIIDPFSD